MRSFVIVFIFFSYTFDIYSQIIITDINNEPIPFVQVISNNKYFFVESNIAGRIEEIDINNLAATDTLFFHHVSYKSEFKVKRDLSGNDTIHLEPRIYELAEASISTNSKKKKFALIDACYRSYQANNDSMLYYSDGKVEYLSKTGKNKYNLRKKEHRSFVNTKIEESMAHRSVGITFLPYIPKPPEYYLPFNYIKKHNLILKQGANGNKEIFSQKGELIGKIETTDATITFSINDNHINPTRKALKTEVTTQGKEFILVFRNNGLNNAAAIDKIDDLLYFKSINKILYKHNKDKKHTKVLQVQELFIEDVNYTNTVNTNSYTNRSSLPQFSSYNSNFWKTCNCEAYYLPNEYLFRGLQEK
ncbi:MAG: hypothetical protein IPL35_14575 [Sphingobacteriales bacterium]|nr:hypothetical protein [Sphingobacteriales bacterium]